MIVQKKTKAVPLEKYQMETVRLNESLDDAVSRLDERITRVDKKPIFAIVDRYTRAEADGRFVKITDTGYLRLKVDDTLDVETGGVVVDTTAKTIKFVVKDENGREVNVVGTDSSFIV